MPRSFRYRQKARERNIYSARRHTPSRIFEQTRPTAHNLTHACIKNRVIAGTILHWFTDSIGLHHLHNLCSRIPANACPKALRNHPELRGIGRLTLLQSMRFVCLVLWNERERRLASFRELRLSDEEKRAGCDE
jgi:fatty acid desaturase